MKIGGLRRFLSVAVLVVADVAALVLGLAGAEYLTGNGGVREVLVLVPALAVIWILIFAAYDLYNRARVRRNPLALVGAGLVWSGLVLVGSEVYPQSGLFKTEVFLATLLSVVFCGLARAFYERGVDLVYSRGIGRIPVVLAGDVEELTRLRRMMESAPGAYSAVDEVDLDAAGLAGLRDSLDRTGAMSVILTGAERLSDEELLELLRSIRLRGVRIRVVPATIALMRGNPVLSESVGLPLLEVRYPRLDNTQRALKRTLDVIGSLVGLVLLSPLLAVLAPLIKFTSPGPVFFRQRRAGADGKAFTCYKLRSMYQGAEDLQAELEDLNDADGAIFKIRDDPRITPVGGVLRRWSVDELPQLWNVLKGEMSIVGPRPLPVRDLKLMGEYHRRRLAAIPGMTGYWLISGRSDLPFEEMVRLDLYYIQNWSLSFDLKIIWRTIGTVLRRKGAY